MFGRILVPNLFVIGAAKGGTSSLHVYLGLHPEVHMSVLKEPHHFSRRAGPEHIHNDRPPLSDAQYSALFDTRKPIRGESSVSYSFWPYPSGVPELIRAAAPDARFIYLVRDPVDRAISHYNHRRFLGREPRSLAEVLADPREPEERYLTASSYATQLERYLEHFEGDRFLILEQRDLLDDRDATLAAAFRFLGVDPTFRTPRFDTEINRGSTNGHYGAIAERVRHSPAYARASRSIPRDLRTRALGPIRSRLSKPVPRVRATPLQREILAERLAGEAERFRALTGRPFDTWCV